MAHQSYAKTVLEMTISIAAKNNGEATCAEISSAGDVRTRIGHKRLLNTLCDLYKTGKLRRIRQGVYGPATGIKQPEKREVMWRLLRMRKRATLDDLVEMAGVSRDYAREWLAALVKREVARRDQRPDGSGVWVLLGDWPQMPEDDSKAARLRELRTKKKAELAKKIEGIENELKAIKTTIAEL
jgi:predicted HTH transcriptional regulator